MLRVIQIAIHNEMMRYTWRHVSLPYSEWAHMRL